MRCRRVAKETSSRYAAQVVEVLAEEKNHQEEGYLTGRLSNNLLVHFKGDESLIGKLVSVHLTESRGFYHVGELGLRPALLFFKESPMPTNCSAASQLTQGLRSASVGR